MKWSIFLNKDFVTNAFLGNSEVLSARIKVIEILFLGCDKSNPDHLICFLKNSID